MNSLNRPFYAYTFSTFFAGNKTILSQIEHSVDIIYYKSHQISTLK